MIKPVLSDGTKVRVSDNGTLITLEHRARGYASGHTQFLFQVELKNDVRVHIFKVSFTAICEFCWFFVIALVNVRNRTAERRRTAKRLCVTRLLVESFVVIFNNNDPLYGYLRTSFSSRVSHRIVERNHRIFVLRRNAPGELEQSRRQRRKRKNNKKAAALLKQKLWMQYCDVLADFFAFIAWLTQNLIGMAILRSSLWSLRSSFRY